MVRGLVRAAAYLPRYSDGTARLRGWDEDPVTLAAAAIERAEVADAPGDAPVTVHAVGDLLGLGEAELASILGTSVALVPHAAAGDPLAAAVRAALSGAGRHWVVVVTAGGPDPERRPPPGEGAAALLIEDARETVLPSLPEDPRSGPLDRLVVASRLAGGPPRWVGDWGADPHLGAAPTSRPEAADRPTTTVSQGAFVSAPTDEESRAARWRFAADRCPACGTTTFPPRGRCRNCRRSDGLRPVRLPPRGGTVVASTWIGPGGQPTEFDVQVEASGGYGVVLAELADGTRVTLAVADATPEQMRIGARVDTTLRRLYPIEGAWRYGRKAIPPAPSPAGGGSNRQDRSR